MNKEIDKKVEKQLKEIGKVAFGDIKEKISGLEKKYSIFQREILNKKQKIKK